MKPLFFPVRAVLCPVLVCAVVGCTGEKKPSPSLPPPPPKPISIYDPETAVPFSFPAITKVPVQSVAEVKDSLGDEELVLGVEINGIARAYPINMLTGPEREIFNDRLGGRAIAATW